MDKEFIKAVEIMRKLQKEYFKTRGGLDQAKAAEKLVDKMLIQINNPQIFDGN